MNNALIIGGGFAGCAAAHQLALLDDWDVTLVERASYLGGGVKTHFHGGHPYTYGPRHFLTPDERLFDYLNKFVPMRRCAEHEFITYIEQDAQFYNFPIHRDDVSRMPEKDQIEKELTRTHGAEAAQNLEEYWLASVGPTLYNKMVKGYTEKMWPLVDGCHQIDDFMWSPKGVALKEGPRAAWDTAISAYPLALNGYDDYFDISTADCRVLLNTTIEDYDVENKRVIIEGNSHYFDLIVSTISPDTLMKNTYGELPFIGREFLKIVLPVEFAFPENVYFVYYAGDEPITRAVEYKKFSQYKSTSTFIGLEIPSNINKLYPYPIKTEIARAQRYYADMPNGIVSLGRAGSYKYIDIDDIIDQAMTMAQGIKEGGLSHPVPIHGEWFERVATEMSKAEEA